MLNYKNLCDFLNKQCELVVIMIIYNKNEVECQKFVGSYIEVKYKWLEG